MAYASSMTIEELSSDGGERRRVVTLTGPGLPFMGAGWKGSNQLVTTWYQGNPEEATQQNLGPREVPSTWKGAWRRTLMGKAPSSFEDETGAVTPIKRPMDMVDVLEDVFRGGRRLRVTWSVVSSNANPDEEGKVVREGRAKDWDFQFRGIHDVEWEITFDWQSRGGSALRVADTRPASAAVEGKKFQQRISALRDAQARAQLAKTLPRKLTLGQLEQLAATPTKLATQLARQVEQITSTAGQVVSLANTLRSQPANVANALVDQAHNCISQVHNFNATLGRTPYELMTTQRKVDSMLRAAGSFGRQGDGAVLVARSAQDMLGQLQQRAQALGLQGALSPRRTSQPGTILAVYVCKDGDTPQRVSLRFYGSPDHADQLLRANRLPLHQPTLPGGKIVIVPVLGGASRPGDG